jgi:streptogramin lyase
VERNVVVTSWEWGEADRYLHDEIASDRRFPTVNAYGTIYGSPEYATDTMAILDPKTNKATLFKMPVQDPEMAESLGPGHAASIKPLQPSAYWGDQKLWDTRVNNHNAMIDKQDRVWLAASVRGQDNPAFCKKGSDHPSAKVFPLDKSSRQVAMLDPKTMKYTFVDTCFTTHHLQFGYDTNDTLWLSGTGPVAGWVNTKMLAETGDAAKSQGWSPFILDTNGNGKRDDFVEPNQPIDPAKDKRIVPGSGPYGVMPSPVDGSIWYTVAIFGGAPGFLRYDPATGLSEVYHVPLPAFGIRGGDIDKDGVVWGSASSGHLVSFDRRKCKGPALASRVSATIALSRATTPGSTSTTRSGLARTFRCPPPTSMTASSRSRTARWSCCVSPTRWASTPRVWMDASTIRTPAGRAAGCGAPAAIAHRG